MRERIKNDLRQSASIVRNTLSVIFVGDRHRPEFANAVAELMATADVSFVHGVEEGVALLADDNVHPELIVVAQSWPGCFSAPQVDPLRRSAPLAGIVELTGTWCEGELRSGAPLPATIRVPWQRFATWLRVERQKIGQDVLPAWAWPVAATTEDHLLADIVAGDARRGGKVVIRGADVFSAELLATAARRRGFEVLTLAHRCGGDLPDRRGTVPAAAITGAVAALWEGDKIDAIAASDLQAFAASVAPAPVVCVLGFIRLEDTVRARQAGAATVLSKPLVWEELFAVLSRLVPSEVEDSFRTTV